MRINDGSICADCKYFEHECDYDACFEYCHNPNEDIKDNFYDTFDELIERCSGFEEE